MRSAGWFVCIGLMCLVVTGCATGRPMYQSPQGDVHTLAALRTSERHIGIARIDDTDTLTFSQMTFGGQGFPDRYVVTAGKHRLVAFRGGIANRMALWFIAEAGKEYTVRHEYSQNASRLWIEDAANGAMVGGLVGSADEPRD